MPAPAPAESVPIEVWRDGTPATRTLAPGKLGVVFGSTAVHGFQFADSPGSAWPRG